MLMIINKQDLTCNIADWENDNKILSSVRRQVFIEEQNVPEDLEYDGYDKSSIHYMAIYANEVVAVARLKPDGQLGRMAVLSKYRNYGIGSELLRFILQNIPASNNKIIFLHAQTSAINLYKKQGFVEHGEIFYEANIPHKKMVLKV